jgi:hypothetical protein
MMFRIVFWDVLPYKIVVDRSLMMEVVRTSETSVDNYFTRQYIPEDNYEQNNILLFIYLFIFFLFCWSGAWHPLSSGSLGTCLQCLMGIQALPTFEKTQLNNPRSMQIKFMTYYND